MYSFVFFKQKILVNVVHPNNFNRVFNVLFLCIGGNEQVQELRRIKIDVFSNSLLFKDAIINNGQFQG